SRRSRAWQSFDRRGTATRDCAGVGCSRGSNYTRWWSNRLLLSRRRFDFLAELNHGAYRRRFFLSGPTRSAGRTGGAWKKTCAHKFFGGSRVDRGAEYWLEDGWVTLRFTQRSGYSVSCIFFVIATDICIVKMSIWPVSRRNLARRLMFTVRERF